MQGSGERDPVLNSVGHNAASCFVTPGRPDVGTVVFSFGGEASAGVKLTRFLVASEPAGEAIGSDDISSSNEERFVFVSGNDFLIGSAVNPLIDSNSVCDQEAGILLAVWDGSKVVDAWGGNGGVPVVTGAVYSFLKALKGPLRFIRSLGSNTLSLRSEGRPRSSAMARPTVTGKSCALNYVGEGSKIVIYGERAFET